MQKGYSRTGKMGLPGCRGGDTVNKLPTVEILGEKESTVKSGTSSSPPQYTLLRQQQQTHFNRI